MRRPTDRIVRAGFLPEVKLVDGSVPMAKGITYVVTATGGLRVRALNTFWAQGQHVDIDPAFLAVCDELRGRVKERLLVPISPNSEFRHGGPTGVVPSGDEMASLRRGAAARGRSPVVVNRIVVDRDQMVRDHLSGKSIKALAREIAAEAAGRGNIAEIDDDVIARIAEKVAEMLPSPDGPSGLDLAAEGRIAAKVVEMLLPAIQSSGGSRSDVSRKRGVIEVEIDTAPLPEREVSDMESHIGDDIATKTTGGSIDDQVADVERILREKDAGGDAPD